MVDYEEYKNQVEKIRHFARGKNVSDFELTKIFENSFAKIERRGKKRGKCNKIIVFLLGVVGLSILGLCHFDKRFFTVTILRNLQSSIYPGLNVLRKISVPIVRRFPRLSEYYDEWCLVENPYFHAAEIECWPCTIVKSVPDLTNRSVGRNFNFGIPFTKSESETKIEIGDFYGVLRENLQVFLEDAARVESTNSSVKSIKDVLEHRFDDHPSLHLANHVTWRINRMKPARILRKVFPKPKESPDWMEQSTERFIFIDESKSIAYSLPSPECSNVAVRCTAGARLIKMVPSPECSQSCVSSTILLSDGNTLWYNWWYWRPISVPASNSTLISINYLTSFC